MFSQAFAMRDCEKLMASNNLLVYYHFSFWVLLMVLLVLGLSLNNYKFLFWVEVPNWSRLIVSFWL